MLDDAAINAALLPPDGDYRIHYFRSLRYCKNEIKHQIKLALGIPHEDIYLLSNSTHCLLTVLYGLSVQGRTLSIEEGSYRPYRDIHKASNEQQVPFVTHIDPNSGKVACISEKTAVLDAAQSVGTVCHHDTAFLADVVFFPLHKHLALQIGVGVLCVSAKHEYNEIREIAKLSESGTANDMVFKSLYQRLITRQIMFNIAMFSLTSATAEKLIILGFEPVTPLYSRTPFLVIKTTSGHLSPGCLEGTVFSLKTLDKCHLRISCYIPGRPGSVPVECSATLINILRSKL
jgi:hypothetical protein